MSLTTAYLTSVKNLEPILLAIQDAGVPERFTNEFLKSLGFKSSTDRAIIGVLKGLRFLDEGGRPTNLYKEFKNKPESKKVLAKSLKAAYEDIFLANEKAYELSRKKLKGIFSTKTGKSESVVDKMAMTFASLAKFADFSEEVPDVEPPEIIEEPPTDAARAKREIETPTFHYNIQIHLPTTKDISVYNAIFKAVRENLME